MIETIGQTFCRECGKAIVLPVRQGPHIREFCNGTCRKRWHRKHPQPTRNKATIDTIEAESRIAELERELAEAHQLIDDYINKKRMPQEWKKQLQERFLQLGKAADWPTLSISVPLAAGERAYRVFGLAASNELLEWASVALRNRDIIVTS